MLLNARSVSIFPNKLNEPQSVVVLESSYIHECIRKPKTLVQAHVLVVLNSKGFQCIHGKFQVVTRTSATSTNELIVTRNSLTRMSRYSTGSGSEVSRLQGNKNNRKFRSSSSSISIYCSSSSRCE